MVGGFSSELEVVYNVLYHVGAVVHERVLHLNDAVRREARHARVEAHIHLLPRDSPKARHHFLFKNVQITVCHGILALLIISSF